MLSLNPSHYLGDADISSLRYSNEAAKSNGHEYYIDDAPVHKNLMLFYYELKHKRPSIVPRLDFSSDWQGVYQRIGIAFDDLPSKRVGYIEVAEAGESKRPKYIVHSHKIRNERYKPRNTKFYTLSSEKMGVAVKNALCYMPRYTDEQVLHLFKDEAQGAVARIRSTALDKLNALLKLPMHTMLTEVSHMVTSGYEPVTAEFKTAIEAVREFGSELRGESSYSPRMCFVWSKTRSLVYKYSDESIFHEITNIEEFPTALREKVAMLQIADKGTALIDVGVRVDSNVFWVFV